MDPDRSGDAFLGIPMSSPPDGVDAPGPNQAAVAAAAAAVAAASNMMHELRTSSGTSSGHHGDHQGQQHQTHHQLHSLHQQQHQLETIKEECLEMGGSDMSELLAVAASHHQQLSPHGSIKSEPGSIQGSHGKDPKNSGTFWPKLQPKTEDKAVKASTVLTNLQRGNIPTILQTKVEEVDQSIHQRAGQGELRSAELDQQGFMDVRDKLGKTPLMWSAAYGQTPTVTLLLQKGADVNAIAFESETALHLAAANGHHDVVRTLLSKGALVDAEDENSCTPLMFAALGNHPHSVKELLQHGANITRENITGQTALSLAVREKASLAQNVLENHIAHLLQTLVGRNADIQD